MHALHWQGYRTLLWFREEKCAKNLLTSTRTAQITTRTNKSVACSDVWAVEALTAVLIRRCQNERRSVLLRSDNVLIFSARSMLVGEWRVARPCVALVSGTGQCCWPPALAGLILEMTSTDLSSFHLPRCYLSAARTAALHTEDSSSRNGVILACRLMEAFRNINIYISEAGVSVASPGFVARRGKAGDCVMGHSRRTSGPGAATARWLIVLWLMQYWSKELWVVDNCISWSCRLHNTWILGCQVYSKVN